MKFKTLTGRLKDISVHRYLIDWQGDSLSHFQETVKDFFYPYWKHDVVCEELIMAGSKCRFDLCNISKRVVVEVNGVAHLTPNSHFHGGSMAKWKSQIKRDDDKRKWCEINDFTLVEIEPDDLPLTKEWVENTFNIIL